MTKSMTRSTEQVISIIKSVGKICLLMCFIIAMFCPITAQAADRYLVTILLVPDKSFEYTDYDSAYLTIVNNRTGQSYNYTLYPYNNFSDKVWLEAGTYSVLDVGIKGRTDMIFECTSDDVVVDRATAFVVNFGDSKIIEQNTTAPTTKALVTTTAVTTTTKPESPTLFPVVTGEYSTTQKETTIQSITQNPSSTIKETTTADTEEPFSERHPVLVPVIFLVVFVTIVCIVFFIILYKKNKAEE